MFVEKINLSLFPIEELEELQAKVDKCLAERKQRRLHRESCCNEISNAIDELHAEGLTVEIGGVKFSPEDDTTIQTYWEIADYDEDDDDDDIDTNIAPSELLKMINEALNL